jgi:hypothetical protein
MTRIARPKAGIKKVSFKLLDSINAINTTVYWRLVRPIFMEVENEWTKT